MRNKVKRGILLTGILCAMSFMVCACGGDETGTVREEQRTDADDSLPAVDDPAPELPADVEEGGDMQDPMQESKSDSDEADGAVTGENGDTASDGTGMKENGTGMSAGTQKEQADAQGASGTWEDGTPDLQGDIKELQDGRLTVTEAEIETADDGQGTSMGVPAPGADDSGFNKVTVTYNEKTLFAVKTIYDGGARFEMEEATAKDLEKGGSVEVWGDISGDEMKASQICLIKVV